MENLQVTIETGKLQGIHGWDPTAAFSRPRRSVRRAALIYTQARRHWEGVRMVDQYGPIACQPVPGSNPREFWTREIHPTGPEFEMSETGPVNLNVHAREDRGGKASGADVYPWRRF